MPFWSSEALNWFNVNVRDFVAVAIVLSHLYNKRTQLAYITAVFCFDNDRQLIKNEGLQMMNGQYR